jgi:hypothetical protein
VWQSRQEERLLEEQRHQILSLEQLGISPADILRQVQPGMWIRIDLMRVRIKHFFKLWVLMTKNLKKITAGKLFLHFFD